MRTTEKLGFRLQTDQPFDDKQRWIELSVPGGETRVVLFQYDEGLKPGTTMNIALWADDVEATARALRAKGVQFTMEPTKADWGTAAAFQDVDGTTFLLSTKL